MKTSSKQSNLTPKATREREWAKSKISTMKEFIEIKPDINEIEMKKIAKTNEFKGWFLRT